MANPEHLAILERGVETWNSWKEDLSIGVRPDLTGANLSGAYLRKVDLVATDLTGANLAGARIWEAILNGANLRGAILSETSFLRSILIEADFSRTILYRTVFTGADVSGAQFQDAILTESDFTGADLTAANFTRATLRGANLSRAILVTTDLANADLTGARVYGSSAWDVNTADAAQTDLIITPDHQPDITVDNLEVAQFIYLLLNNSRIREVIDTITSKAVLILGRFTSERKSTLDALRDALRQRNYLPIVFDFEKPANRDYTETVLTLAGLARFVIADLTDPRSIPQELMAIIPQLQSVPIRPLLLGDQEKWAMFNDFARRPQVIPPLNYTNDAMLLRCLDSDVIAPAEQKARELGLGWTPKTGH